MVRFSPPLHAQRHTFVIEFIKKSRATKVLDLGCSDCKLLKTIRFHRHGVEFLTGVDINGGIIRRNMYSLAPLPTDYLQPGARPLTIELYQGSVTEREPCTRGYDLITCIELVEHLHLRDVERFTDVVFGYMVPRAVIVSTPNADFNPLLPGLTGFRHKDHKFEWSRAEFQTWALRVCSTYGYSVEFTGVGLSPDQDTDVGFCSQIGVFHRSAEVPNAAMSDGERQPTAYRLLYRVLYPSLYDNNIFQRTLVCEVLYAAEQLKRRWMEEREWCCAAACWDASSAQEVYRCGNWVRVPLLCVWSCAAVRSLCRTVGQLREALLEDSRVRLDPAGEALMLSADEDDEELEDHENEASVSMSEGYSKEDWEETQ